MTATTTRTKIVTPIDPSEFLAISKEIQADLDNLDSNNDSKPFISWLPFAAIAAVAAGFGLFAGTALSGGLF